MHVMKPFVALAATSMIVLVACSGSSTTNTPPPSTHSSSISAPAHVLGMNPGAQAPAPAIPGAKKGGTVTVLSSFQFVALDPDNVYQLFERSLLSGLLVRSLTQYVYDPTTKEMVLVPDLATDLGRPSADFMTWRFTLRPGITFENGQPVTAEDLKYGIERSFDNQTFFHSTYSNQYFLHGDTYKGPYKTPGPYNGVTVHGRTITIHMAKPFPDMPYWGAWPEMSPIPPGKASDPATYQKHPWATGPYMVKPGSYLPNKSLVLVKNPFWDLNSDPGRHQYVDEFDFNFAGDDAKIDQTMLADAGSAQTTIAVDTLLPDDYQQINKTAGDRLVLGSRPCAAFFFPDNRKITDIRVRHALAYAYPYRAAAAAAGTIPGVTRLPATNIMPPGTPGRVAYNPLPGHPPWETDPAKARALLAAAGKLGYPIRWGYYSGYAPLVAEKNVIARALKAAGFDPHPTGTTGDLYTEFTDNPNAEANVRANGWCSDWLSGSDWFPQLFATTNIPTDVHHVGFGYNQSFFSQPAVDDRIDAIPRLLLTEQAPAWNALDKLIQTRYFPVIVTGYFGAAMMRGSKVHNDFNDPTSGTPTWKDLWLG